MFARSILLSALVTTNLWAVVSAQELSPLERLEQQLDRADPPTTDAPSDEPKGYAGLTVDVTDRGVEVLAIAPNGAAEKAGVRVGDLIVGAAGRRVASLEDLGAALEGLPPGAELELQLDRQSQRGHRSFGHYEVHYHPRCIGGHPWALPSTQVYADCYDHRACFELSVCYSKRSDHRSRADPRGQRRENILGGPRSSTSGL